MMGFWRRYFLPLEFLAALIATAVLYYALARHDGHAGFLALVKGNRAALYAALAAVFGSLLGFAITAVSIAIAFSQSPQLRVVRESIHYETLWKVFTASIRTLGLATAVAIVALVVDRDDAPNIIMLYAVFFVLILAAARVFRVIWVLENVVRLVTQSA